jgi:hypothetical protein
MQQQISDGTSAKPKSSVRDGQAASRRAFPLNDFISRWRQGGRNDNEYLDEEMPSSPLLPPRRNKNTSPDPGDPHEDEYVPYPAPPAFLEPKGGAKSGGPDDTVVNYDDDEDEDDDNDDAQSIKSYDDRRISSYDSRSSRQEPIHDEVQPEESQDHGSGGGNPLRNFFSEASNFLLAKLHGDTSRTRLKEASTEMKVLR